MLARAKAELEKVFGPELSQLAGQDRAQLLDALQAISIWEFWESLRTDLGMGRRQAAGLLAGTLAALLAQAGQVASQGRRAGHPAGGESKARRRRE
jgi:hypothetical protein